MKDIMSLMIIYAIGFLCACIIVAVEAAGLTWED